MGYRTLKRVPLDFNAPLNEVWEGYINPNQGPKKCEACDGTGYNAATKQIADDFYDHDGCGQLDMRELYRYNNEQIRALALLSVLEHGIFWCPECWEAVPRLSPEHHSGFCMCTGEEIPCIFIDKPEALPKPDKAKFIVGGRWAYEYNVAPDGSRASRPPWRVVGDCRKWCDNITQDEVQALVDAGRLWDFTRVPINEQQVEDVKKKVAMGGNNWLPYDNGRIPTADEVNAFQHQGGLGGHDCINRHILIEARAKRLGVWGKCEVCRGKGERKQPRKQKKAYKKWQEYEPPTGVGFQLWETVTEGSPVSPVFASAEKLAEWCEENATVFGDMKTSKEKWLEMFSEEDGADVGSLLIGDPATGFLGPAIDLPKEPKSTVH